MVFDSKTIQYNIECHNKIWFPYARIVGSAKYRLFCFPHAGGTASKYSSFFESFDKNFEIFAIQIPGRENRFREIPYTSIKLLCEEIFNVLVQLSDKPFVFFGHSMGAVIAFELARLFHKSNLQLPKHLLLSSHRAPDIQLRHKPLYNLPEKELLEELSKLGGTAKELFLNSYLFRTFIPTIRADLSIAQTYVYEDEKPLPISISVFGGDNDMYVGSDDLTGWQKQTTKSFTLNLFKGGHFYLYDNKYDFLSIIKKILYNDI